VLEVEALEAGEAGERCGERRELVVREVKVAQPRDVGERQYRRGAQSVEGEVEHLQVWEASHGHGEGAEAVAVEVELLQLRQVAKRLELHVVVAQVEVRQLVEEGHVLSDDSADACPL